MLKIHNGNIEKTVTKGAYLNYYKRLGFEVSKETSPKTKVKEAKIVTADIPKNEKNDDLNENKSKKVDTKDKK